MKLKQIAIILAGGISLYVTIAALSRDPKKAFWSGFLERLAQPVPNAFADLSGTRLKAKYILGADGSRLYDPEVLHDSQLNLDCKFAVAADGKMRCLPTGADGTLGQIDYLDAACTKPMALLGWSIPTPPSGCPQVMPKYQYQQGPSAYCSNVVPNHYFAVEGTIVAGVNRYVKQGTNCVAGGTNQTAVIMKDEEPAATFAEGTPTTDP